MSTLSALLVLGQGAFLGGSWWVGRALGMDGRERRVNWVVVASLVLAVVGVTPEILTALSGTAQLASAAHAVGMLSVGSMAVSQAGLSAIAGGRAVRAEQRRRWQSAQALALLARGDAAFAGGRYDEARAAYQEEVGAAQGAGEDEAIRRGLARVAWLDYVSGRFKEARSSIAIAAGGGQLEDSIGCSVVLLAGCLGLSSGRLEVARPAIEDAVRMAENAGEVSQLTLAQVALGCEHWLEGWGESGRQFIEAHARERMDVFDRHVAGALLIALSLRARERQRPEDARALAGLAAELVEGNAVLAPLAHHAEGPEASPWLERPAREMSLLVSAGIAARA
jgi:tetratricopeptide (TPR) repeat protein